jgi:O-succinylbenzoic acid--CoA ligase
MAQPALGQLIRLAASQRPDQPALLDASFALTWLQLDEQVQRVANALVAQGVGPGDRVALVLPHGRQMVEALWAIWSLAAVAVPLDPRLPSAERDRRIALVEATCTLTAEQPTAEELPVASETVVRAPRHADTPALIIFTSGTTGTAKGAILSQGALIASARQHLDLIGVQPTDRWLASLPLFHVGGLGILVRSALAQIPAALAEDFSAEAMADAIDRHQLTHLSLVATTLQRLLALRHALPSGLRLAMIGGGPAPREMLEEAIGRGLPVATTYGLTETASQVAVLPPGSPAALTASAGWPLSSSQIRIDGTEAEGEILIAGPTLFSGYWQDEAASRQVLQGGWLHTGDVGRLGDQGELWVGGRAQDLIISGGEKVTPYEVELVLRSHPAVLDAAVFGHLDATWGQVPWALVVVPDRRIGAQSLLAHCRSSLAPYQVPKEIRFVSQLPKGPLGKVLHGELAALAEQAEVRP